MNVPSTSLCGLVSLHDVMPETRGAVTRLLRRFHWIPPRAFTLLVVPGRQWSHADLAWLRDLRGEGYVLAGHGWLHRCGLPRTLYHRLHSALLSRYVAEHLALDDEGIIRLVRRCFDWFGEHGLGQPSLYVPPAWAMGSMTNQQLRWLPFRYYETLGGVHDAETGRFNALPLVGYEADTPLRGLLLKLFNEWNIQRARQQRLPLRVGIHPHDLSYRLRGDLERLLESIDTFAGYQDTAVTRSAALV